MSRIHNMTIAQSIARTINAVSMRAAKHNNAISRQHAEREKNFGKSMQIKIQLINKDLNKKLSTADGPRDALYRPTFATAAHPYRNRLYNKSMNKSK